MTRFIVILGLVAVAACSKKEAPPAPPPAAETPTVASVIPPAPSEAAPAPSASTAAAPEVPVEEDFEDEANAKVNAQTLDAQLDALEKEIKAN